MSKSGEYHAAETTRIVKAVYPRRISFRVYNTHLSLDDFSRPQEQALRNRKPASTFLLYESLYNDFVQYKSYDGMYWKIAFHTITCWSIEDWFDLVKFQTRFQGADR